MCYSMDDEQEENEKKKVHFRTFDCIFIVGQDIYYYYYQSVIVLWSI